MIKINSQAEIDEPEEIGIGVLINLTKDTNAI
jgi:hypothetical protein